MISAQFFTTLNGKIFLDTLKMLVQPWKWKYWLYKDKFAEDFKKYLNAETSEVFLFYNWRSALHHALRLVKNNLFLEETDLITDNPGIITDNNPPKAEITETDNFCDSNQNNLWLSKENAKSSQNLQVSVSSKSPQNPQIPKVLIAGYTCVSVVNAVKQAGFKPVYVDIDESLNMTLDNIKKAYSENTIAVIVQHTFWNPAQIDEIVKWAHNHNLVVIEDCAHALWASVWEKKVGTFGDMAIFSTWRDKVISSVTWWILLVNNTEILNKKSANPVKILQFLIMPSNKLIFQNLFYNIVGYLAWKTYDIKLWKVLMYLAWKFGLIPKILTKKEKSCNFSIFYYDFPNALAYLAYQQLKIVDKTLQHRKKIAEFYKKELVWLKKLKLPKTEAFYSNIYFWFPVLIEDEKLWQKLVDEGKKQGVYFGVYWSGINIVPPGTDLEACGYKKWTCPNAESLSKQVLVLPNHYQVNLKDVEKVVNLIKNILN